MIRRHPRSPLFPYTTLFRSGQRALGEQPRLLPPSLVLPGEREQGDVPPVVAVHRGEALDQVPRLALHVGDSGERDRDRKSTRLNSSHANISYAVFCLKKKKN